MKFGHVRKGNNHNPILKGDNNDLTMGQLTTYPSPGVILQAPLHHFYTSIPLKDPWDDGNGIFFAYEFTSTIKINYSWIGK